MNAQTIVQVGWSYPTSTNAVRFGFKAGCYTVATKAGEVGLPKYKRGFATFSEAQSYAESLGMPFSRYTEKPAFAA